MQNGVGIRKNGFRQNAVPSFRETDYNNIIGWQTVSVKNNIFKISDEGFADYLLKEGVWLTIICNKPLWKRNNCNQDRSVIEKKKMINVDWILSSTYKYIN